MIASNFVFFLTFAIYALCFDSRLTYIFFGLWGLIALYHIMTPWKHNSTRKRFNIATWDEPQDGIIQNRYEIDVTNINTYIAEVKEKLGMKITLTHVVVKAIGEILKAAPDINGKIVLGKYIPFDHANVCCLVDVQDGQDLAFFLVEDVDKLNIEDISEEIDRKGKRIKALKDESYQARVKTTKHIPSFIMNFLGYLNLIFTTWLGVPLKSSGIDAHPLGGAVVSNVGVFGVKDGTAPVVAGGFSPCSITINQVVDRPIVKNGKIEIAPTVMINVSIDHRYLDGSRAKTLSRIMDLYLQNPWKGSRLGEPKNAEAIKN
jgi:pyruvate/2-oxoglutarate dehydrogenase complex dihydrolipoamide acyltransferase (E2) component